MRAYFLRRLLLIPPTLLGVTLLVFCVTRFAPGGPVEQAILRAQAGETGAGGGSARGPNRGALSAGQIEQLKAYYGFDQPVHVAYLHWLGKVLRGDLGSSFTYGEPVRQVIAQCLPVTLAYGAIGLALVYLISIPLGILKAVKHRSVADTISSVVVFVGYAIPGYALGALLVVFLAARLGWFPMGGFVSEGWGELGWWGRAKDFSWHAVLPLTCYTLGGFAFVTLLTKNQIMDNLAADHVRTAVAKGVSFRRAVFSHAFRNSLIPLATDFGQTLGALVIGSILIESIFDINGMGLLFYHSIQSRDAMVVMGVLLVEALMLLAGNIAGDVLVALADPRVRFK